MALKIGSRQDIEHEYQVIELMMKHITDGSIINVYDMGKSCGTDRYYLVMDYKQGKDLFTHMADRDQEINLFKIFYQITKVVNMMHSMSPPMYHCDIKPENIMVTSDGDAYLIDFGNSTNIPELIKGYTPVYTPIESYIKRMSQRDQTNLNNTYVYNSGAYTAKYSLNVDLYAIATSILYYFIYVTYGVRLDQLGTWDITEITHSETIHFLNIDAIQNFIDTQTDFYPKLSEKGGETFVRLIQTLIFLSPEIRVYDDDGYKTYHVTIREKKLTTMESPPVIVTASQLLDSFDRDLSSTSFLVSEDSFT